MVLLIMKSRFEKWLAIIGKINPTFSDKPKSTFFQVYGSEESRTVESVDRSSMDSLHCHGLMRSPADISVAALDFQGNSWGLWMVYSGKSYSNA